MIGFACTKSNGYKQNLFEFLLLVSCCFPGRSQASCSPCLAPGQKCSLGQCLSIQLKQIIELLQLSS